MIGESSAERLASPLPPIRPNQMNVSELISFLQTQPKDLPVVYMCCSEHCTLDATDIKVENLCLPRSDGWVANARPDKPKIPYLVLPGN